MLLKEVSQRSHPPQFQVLRSGKRTLSGPNLSVRSSYLCTQLANLPYSGPLIRLPAFGLTMIVINSYDLANELLDKRITFACKPRWPMAELLGRQANVGFMYYGKAHKMARKALHGAMDAHVLSTKWSDFLDERSTAISRHLLRSPDTFYDHIERLVTFFLMLFDRDSSP